MLEAVLVRLASEASASSDGRLELSLSFVEVYGENEEVFDLLGPFERTTLRVAHETAGDVYSALGARHVIVSDVAEARHSPCTVLTVLQHPLTAGGRSPALALQGATPELCRVPCISALRDARKAAAKHAENAAVS